MLFKCGLHFNRRWYLMMVSLAFCCTSSLCCTFPLLVGYLWHFLHQGSIIVDYPSGTSFMGLSFIFGGGDSLFICWYILISNRPFLWFLPYYELVVKNRLISLKSNLRRCSFCFYCLITMSCSAFVKCHTHCLGYSKNKLCDLKKWLNIIWVII